MVTVIGRTPRRLSRLVLIGVVLLGGVTPPVAGAPRVGVLYPDTYEPYRSVFRRIAEGVEQRLEAASVRQRAVTPDDAPGVRVWLAEHAVEAVITLGRDATLAYERTHLNLPQVIGALNISPQTRPQATGVSLAVDPALVFATLKQVAPRTTRVWVVFSPDRDRWLIDLAQGAAAAHQLTLIAREARDSQASASQFAEILEAANPATDVLWLLINTELVDTQIVLPRIVVRSWQRRLLVCSNSLSHADLGVVFAVFADDVALGRRLAEVTLHRLQAGTELGIEPLRTIKRALNLRAAAQIGLTVEPALERQFDLVYPLQP